MIMPRQELEEENHIISFMLVKVVNPRHREGLYPSHCRQSGAFFDVPVAPFQIAFRFLTFEQTQTDRSIAVLPRCHRQLMIALSG